MVLYHASPKKYQILKPAKPVSFSKSKLIHDSVLWFSKRPDHTIFMVLFRYIEEEILGKYRFFDYRKKALFYPDSYGPLVKNLKLFTELYQKAQELELAMPCKVYVHEVVELPQDTRKSKWGDYYTRGQVPVAKVLEIADGVKYLKEKGWSARILTH